MKMINWFKKILGFPYDWVEVWEDNAYYDVDCLDINGYSYISHEESRCFIEFSLHRNQYRLKTEGYTNSLLFTKGLNKLKEYTK